jgi:hypothetical protein
MSLRAHPPPTTLGGHWLLFARVAWVAVAITALAIVVFSVPISFEHYYSSVCTDASEVCSEQRRWISLPPKACGHYVMSVCR